ncbi:prenyltransferase [Pseudidiomarina sp. 1ASP75-14]|uniref:prenyltransferase n=1 Tax=Pseudidiomarina terrestris TaxID=2820060 RepID=UPI00264B8A52|nr:prenyltransferase [Pseudidiomarina sp. 1ASP75-14]MDN7137201.1 prenyltransferase [Pseudidiomarina sp. 1ASP75-14]
MLATLIKTTRPSFLLLTLAMVALAAALAESNGFSVATTVFSLVALGAVSAHACVNVLNEVHDARSGLDDLTQRTPFSGGSGALQANPQALKAASRLGKALLALLITIGCYFIYLRGWSLLPLGIAGMVLVMAYTPMLTRRPWLCLIAPGLGFGPLMLTGSYFVLTGEYSWSVLAVSLIPFFLVNNLLLLNQFPDLTADVQVGRRNLLITSGPGIALRIFRWFLFAAYSVLAILVAVGILPPLALLGMLSLSLAIPLYYGIANLNKPQQVPHRLLGLNVAINISLPLLIAIGLALSS